jgi:PhnB protein
MEVNVYLNFPGNTEEAFNFYKSVFGGEFTALMRMETAPDGGKLPEHIQGKIMHIALPLGKNLILMATDSIEEMGHKSVPGNNFTLSISPGSEEEMYTVFNALAEGGKIGAPLEKMFWGAYWGMLFDKFGIQWMVNYDPNQTK